MFWYITLGILVIVVIVFIIVGIKAWDGELWLVGAIMCGILLLANIFGIVCAKIEYKKEIEVFKQTKIYIEEITPTLEQTDNYSITNSRIEMNKWLYEVQFRYKNYRFWTLVPEEVMELEQIK